jgi:beta-hydroxyacyl-ACP dehydratase FabZ
VPILDVREIMQILPHRYPMLLIDRITERELMVFARGYKNISANEPMFPGHFPGNPLLPGVLMVEALAQLAGAVIVEPGEMSRKVSYLTGMDKIRFRRPVVPGDRFDMLARVAKIKMNVALMEVEGRVDDKLVVSGELRLSIVTDPSLSGYETAILSL